MNIDETIIINRLRAAGCIFAEEEATLLIVAARTPEELTALVESRVAGLPLEHVIGWAEFCDLRIKVDRGVFVPRYRTEFLVRQAAALTQSGAVVVDLCCGSGAVGAALTAILGQIELHATDIDPAAAQCARRNITGGSGHVYEGDLYKSLPDILQGCVDIIVANAPYVPSEEIRLLPYEARMHEASVALDGGMDGHDIQRRLAVEAPIWLAPGGHLLVETSQRQAPQTVQIFISNGLVTQVARSEELDATVVIGTKPSLSAK